MSPKIIIMIISFMYGLILRDLLKKAIDDPDEEWDETVLEMLDNLLGFKPKDVQPEVDLSHLS